MRLLVFFVTALGLYAQTPDEVAWRIVENGVHEGNPIKRSQAILALSLVQPTPRPVALLINALDDKDAEVREAACATLGQIKARAAIPKLRIAIADPVPEVTFGAAKALYNMGDQTGIDVMMSVLLGEQPDSSGFISGSIRSMKLKLHDPKALFMMGIREGAGFAGPFGMGVPITEGLMKDNQAPGKTVAALLLASDRSPQSLEALKEALVEKNWTVRAAAARAIAQREATALYDNVAMLLNDRREEVQFSAAAAVIRLKQPASAPTPPTRHGRKNLAAR
ncbi:MAG: HEAT repeat domain-containing protein [Acidobacteriota bacterium]|nr:HEAT repeat domain-containing protein [Acidobacteriota bacterium]